MMRPNKGAISGPPFWHFKRALARLLGFESDLNE